MSRRAGACPVPGSFLYGPIAYEGALLENQISRIIEEHYDIGTVSDVYEIFGGFTNRVFGVRTREKNDTYFVRRYRKGVILEEIQFEHGLINHAIGKGLTICAGVVPARNGETMVRPADSNRVFAVYEYLRGEDKYTWDNTDLTDSEFRSAAGVLAEFHNAVRDYEPGGFHRKEQPITAFLPVITGNLIRLGQKNDKDGFQSYYRSNLKAILRVIERNPIAPGEIKGLPVIPTHYDYHPGNLKWDDDVVAGLFDFDWSKMDLRLFDLAMALVYFCSRWGGHGDGALRMDKFSLFLGSYNQRLQEAKGLDPLGDNEKRLLPKMLTIANIYIVHWEVSDYYGAVDADTDQYLVFLKHNVRLMYWLETHRSIISDAIGRTEIVT